MKMAYCFYCGTLTMNTGTKRCDKCWELETRLKGMNGIVLGKMLTHLVTEGEIGFTLDFDQNLYSMDERVGRLIQANNVISFEFQKGPVQ